ncbi:MAG: DegV family protein [Acholeplasmataceae bacterium]|nr:DegV family protein [Acholeplasmataceae bacterium]
MKTAIITDSAANLSKETLKKYPDLYVIPLMIVIDGKSFRDGIEITSDDIYHKLDHHDVSTSLPSMDDLNQLLEDLKKKGYTDALVINLSSGLSGTYNAFRLALEHVEGLNITHYDSKTLGGGLSLLVEQACDMVKAEVTIPQIIKTLNKLRFEDSIALYTINTLKYLRKGGRIGKVEGTIGNILRIKPVITVNDEGVYVTVSKGFGIQRSFIAMKDLLIEKFQKAKIDLIVHFGDDIEKAKQLGESLKRELNIRNISLSKLTPVLGIHTGPMMFAYVARKVYE